MKQITIALFIICFALSTVLPFGARAWADDPKARAIMEKVDARNDGDNQTADMEMILIDKKDNKRVRKLRTFSKDKGDDTLKLMFFRHPADVKDTAFLNYDYDKADKDDEQCDDDRSRCGGHKHNAQLSNARIDPVAPIKSKEIVNNWFHNEGNGDHDPG